MGGTSNRGEKQCMGGEGGKINGEQGMLHLREGSFDRHETLGENNLEGEGHWVSLPHKGDHYITPFHMT